MEREPEQNLTAEWKAFEFHMATDKDCPRIVQHLAAHFMAGEPMNQQMSWKYPVWSPEREFDTAARVAQLVKNRLSFYVTEKGSDEIVAVNLISDSRYPVPPWSIEPRSEATRLIRALVTRSVEEVEPKFQAKFKCDHYATLFITSVHSGYRGQGVALEMYERSLKYLKAKGFPVVKGEFSHPGTQRLAEKLGFEELHRFYLRDQVDERGEKLFPNATDECAVATAKRL